MPNTVRNSYSCPSGCGKLLDFEACVCFIYCNSRYLLLNLDIVSNAHMDNKFS